MRVMLESDRTPKKTGLLLLLRANVCDVPSWKAAVREAMTASGVVGEKAAPKAATCGLNCRLIACGIPGDPDTNPPETRFGREAAPEEDCTCTGVAPASAEFTEEKVMPATWVVSGVPEAADSAL